MIPRLSVLIQSACRFAQTSDPKVRASGYAHTYFNPGDADLAFLAVFPSDSDIADAAQEAWDKASNLWDLLGINPLDLSTPSAGVHSVPTLVLPSVTSWFLPGEDPVYDYEDDPSDDEDWEAEEEPLESDILQKLIDAEQNAPLRTAVTEDRMRSLTCAAIALTLNDMSYVHALDEPSEDEKARIIQEDSAAVHQAMRAVLNPLPIRSIPGADPIHPFDRPVASLTLDHDLSGLLRARRAHETERAWTGVRTKERGVVNKSASTTSETGDERPLQESTRCVLIREMQQVISEEQERGVGTGLEHDVCWWTHVAAASKSIAASSTGNSANAAMVAGARAASVMTLCLKHFEAQKVKMYREIADAQVGVSTESMPKQSPLIIGSHVLVLHQARILVGRIIALYARSGGKTGFHCSQQEVKSIGLVSYAVVQVYEHSFQCKFRAIHQDLASLQVYRFLHVSADNILLRLSVQCSLAPDRRMLEIDASAYDIYKRLSSPQELPAVIGAVKALTKARRAPGKQAADGDGEARAAPGTL
ncbi:hypothetical protein BN946_scf185027.g4 [Trametes cinnabarina]|uniref:Uncharacterized protein n=1 Tax=Pycnoporus cinnabarinus TaxID=5643 RepID=A0A060SPN3_PYCCI|nr:hypothetical protein BN946_scf185027.g4 [Trametes cinnabarina]